MRPLHIKLLICMLLLWAAGACPGADASDDTDAACLACHDQGSTASMRQMDGAAFFGSIHGSELTCLECHPQAADEAHQLHKTVTPVACRDCHDVQGVHGAGSTTRVRCFDCHGKHDILPRGDAASTLSARHMARTCGACHPHRADTPGLKASLLSFRIKGHGKGDLAEHFSRTRCLDCHQGRAAHMEKAPLTTTGCYRCHDAVPGNPAWLGTFHGANGSGRAHWGDLLYLLCLAITLTLFIWGWGRRVGFWRRGGPQQRSDRPTERLTRLFLRLLDQRRLFPRPSHGWRHYTLFLGLSLPLAVVVITQVRFQVPALAAGLLSLTLDLVGLTFLAGIVWTMLTVGTRGNMPPRQRHAALAGLLLAALIVTSGFLVEGARISLTGNASWTAPVGRLAALTVPVSGTAAQTLWRVHLLLVLLLMALIPFSRFRHMVAAPLNLFFGNLGAQGRIRPVPLADGTQVPAYPDGLRITWKTRLDLDACLSCGRCSAVCPANQAQQPLDPMQLVLAMRTSAMAGNGTTPDSGVADDALWACSTCQACMQACPARVEHVDKIVGLRRDRVLNTGRLPQEAARLLRHLELHGDPGGLGSAHRNEWARTWQPSAVAPAPSPAPLTLWMGCQGYAHPHGRKVAAALTRLVERAGETPRVLGGTELCCGDPARRLGGEELFQTLARQNIERLRQMQVQRLLVFCPHCYNTLANEYPDQGSEIEVIPALSWVANQITSGTLTIARPWPHRVVFHDPCYLARINGLVDAPRHILEQIPGLQVQFPDRSGAETFCCGAGGGRMWLHESGLRINQLRAEQCRATGAEQAATACPFCLVMLADGLAEARMGVLDIIEIVEWVTR